MKTQYFTAASLDGFIATEDDSLDWLFPLGDLNNSTYPEFIENVGALAMGSATYEWMLRNAEKVVLRSDHRGPMLSQLGCSPVALFRSSKVRIYILSKAMCAIFMLKCGLPQEVRISGLLGEEISQVSSTMLVF